ncbi:MAG TPA: hypothetical protein VJ461_03355 [Candidatus Nanoarchaeia archaeon]|nr:hypothetical protein [Candidatus Nanoarchaeia archaeon]
MKKVFVLSALALILLSVAVLADADINDDGKIDLSDLILVTNFFGKTSGYDSEADTDTNGIIDIYDVVYVASRVGTTITCTDGTPYSQCSATKPKYCQDGTLINKCSTCGCPTGYACSNDQCVSSGTYQGPEPFGWGNGGWFSNILIDKYNPDVLYAANDMGGVFRSDDGANHWTDLSMNFAGTPVWYLVLSPDGNTLYAQSKIGFQKSTDKGVSWTALTAFHENESSSSKPIITRYYGMNGDSLRRTRTFLIDPADQNIIYVAGERGKDDYNLVTPLNYLYKTIDGGKTWQELSAICNITKALVLDSNSRSTLYAACPDGVKKSIDGGLTWVVKSTGITNLDTMDMRVDNSNGALYLLTKNGFYKSTDKAETWVMYNGQSGLTIVTPREMGSIEIDETDSNHIFVAFVGYVYETKDGGLHWNMIYRNWGYEFSADPDFAYNWSCSWLHCGGPTTDLTYNEAKKILYGVGDTGLVMLDLDTSPLKWIIKHRGLYVAGTFTLGFFSKDEIYAGGADTVLMKTTNGGQTWKQITGKDRWYFTPNFWVWSIGLKKTEPHKIYICNELSARTTSVKAALFQSFDGGDTWENITNRLPDSMSSTKCSQVLVDKNNENIIYVLFDNKGVYRSTDNANTFTRITDSIPSVGQMTFTSASLVIDPSNSNTLYLVPEYIGSGGTKVYRSTDNGVSWTEIYSYGDNSLGGMAVFADKYHSIYLSLHHRLQRSRDNGATWQTVMDLGKMVPYVWSWYYYFSIPVFNPLNNLTYVMITPWDQVPQNLPPAGIYASADFGTSWERKYSLAHQGGGQIYLLDDHDYLYVPATSGLWKYRLDIP